MKTLKIIVVALAAFSAVSCGYLEFDETNGLRDYDGVYSYFDETKQMLTHVYSYIPQDFGAIGGAMRDCAGDDAEFGDTGGAVQYMNNGSWSALNTVDDAWSSIFLGVVLTALFQPFSYFVLILASLWLPMAAALLAIYKPMEQILDLEKQIRAVHEERRGRQ